MFIFYALLFIQITYSNQIPLHSSHQDTKSAIIHGRKLKRSLNPVLRKKPLDSNEDVFSNQIYQMDVLNEIISRVLKRDDDDYDDGDEKFIKPKLLERRKRLAEKKRDLEGRMEVCDTKLCSDQGFCRIYIKADSKVQLCSCYPGYAGEYCQLGSYRNSDNFAILTNYSSAQS